MWRRRGGKAIILVIFYGREAEMVIDESMEDAGRARGAEAADSVS